MHGGHHGTSGMGDQAEPCDEKSAGVEPDGLRTDPLSQWGHQGSLHRRAIRAHLFEGNAIGQHPAHSAPTPGAVPAILSKAATLIQPGKQLGCLLMELLDPSRDFEAEPPVYHGARHSRTASIK